MEQLMADSKDQLSTHIRYSTITDIQIHHFYTKHMTEHEITLYSIIPMIMVSVARRGVTGRSGAGRGVARCNISCNTSFDLQNITMHHSWSACQHCIIYYDVHIWQRLRWQLLVDFQPKLVFAWTYSNLVRHNVQPKFTHYTGRKFHKCSIKNISA